MPARKKSTTTASSENETKITVKTKVQIPNLEDLRTQVNKEINSFIDLLITEFNNIQLLKKHLEEETALKERQQRQKEEEQNFTFELARRKRQVEFEEEITSKRKIFDEEKRKKEEELKHQKENLDKKEEEFIQLQQQVRDFPQRLEKAINETKKQVTGDLTKDFENANKLLIQKYESELKLLQQQVKSIQLIIQQQAKEIDSLKQEKTKALEQMKDLAIAVVRGKEKETQSFQPA